MLIAPFPYPLPGECLYSIFCRYHVRSGNHSERQTSLDLFGQGSVALATSITTPTLAYMSWHWGMQDMGMDTTSLVKKHSAFQYYTVGMSTSKQESHWKAISIGYRRKKTLAKKHNLVAHRSGRLRYCPLCAEGEKALYGEAYWHTAHQLDGVCHCPLHKAGLVESDIDFGMANKHYLPAALYTSRPYEKADTGFDDEEVPGLGDDIIWLLENGANLGGGENVIAHYLKAPDSSLAVLLLTQEQLSSLAKVHKGTEERGVESAFRLYTPLQHAAYMRRRYGGAAAFQKQYIG